MGERITSTANPKVKALRKLRDRKERAQSGLFTIEGLRIVGEALQQGAEVDTLVAAPELLNSEFGEDLLREAAGRGVPVMEVGAAVFESFSLKEGPQGIAAVVRQRWTPLEDITPAAGDLWVALDAVADPGNLGTILRTADATGARGVILLDHSTDPYDPTAIRASMGAIFTQRLARATFDEFVAWKTRQSIALVGTSDKARQDYHTCVYPDPMVLLMGSERMGLQERALHACDLLVAMPMLGSSDSLNLAVATGVTLYEILNQRRDRRQE